MEMYWGNLDCMDSCTTSILLFRLFYFLQLPNQLCCSVRLLGPYYICFVNCIDFLVFLLHSQIVLFERLCFVCFLPERYEHTLRVLLFTLFIITVATAFIPFSPSPPASHWTSLAISSLSENAIFSPLYMYYIFILEFCDRLQFFLLLLLCINYIIALRFLYDFRICC